MRAYTAAFGKKLLPRVFQLTFSDIVFCGKATKNHFIRCVFVRIFRHHFKLQCNYRKFVAFFSRNLCLSYRTIVCNFYKSVCVVSGVDGNRYNLKNTYINLMILTLKTKMSITYFFNSCILIKFILKLWS